MCVWGGGHRCILFVLCICLCTCLVSLWLECLRDRNDLMSIKAESCVVTTGWKVYESYKHSCILHVDKCVWARGLKNENCVAMGVSNTGTLTLVYGLSAAISAAKAIHRLFIPKLNIKIIPFSKKNAQYSSLTFTWAAGFLIDVWTNLEMAVETSQMHVKTFKTAFASFFFPATQCFPLGVQSCITHFPPWSGL